MSAVALASRAGRLLAEPPDAAQVHDVRLLLTELSGVMLLLETDRRRSRRRLDTMDDPAQVAVLRRRLKRLRIELAELEEIRAPLRRRRAELGAERPTSRPEGRLDG